MADLVEDPTVLVVDDEAEIVELIEAFVPEAASVRIASDAAEALATYDETVDLIFLDRRLPDRPGDEVLREVRARDSACRIAMVSAADEAPNGEAYDAYISKPFLPEDVEETAERLLSVDS